MDITQLSTEELKQALAMREANEQKHKEQVRKNYEARRNALATQLVKEAFEIEAVITAFHEKAKKALMEFREESRQYGGLRANSKGGYSIESESGMKATLRFHAIWAFDERAGMAEELLKEFLADTVKKRDVPVYEILMSLLERNSDGKLEPRRVMEIIKHESKFTDERWVKAIKLLKESYHEQASKYYMEFAVKNADGKWEAVNLNFSAL